MSVEAAWLAGLLAAAAALLAVGLVMDARTARRRHLAERLAAHCLPQGRGATSPSLSRAMSRSVLGALGPLLATTARAVFSRQRDRDETRALLRAAGLDSDAALALYAAAKAGGFVLGAAAGLAVRALALPDGDLLLSAALCGGVGFAGMILPEMALKSRRDARRARMREALPDAIDLLVIAGQGGQSLNMAIDRVWRELEAFSPEIAAELKATSAEMQALTDRAEALKAFGERIGTSEARAVAMTLSQSARYGTPYNEDLSALSQDLRQARMLALEERGAKLPALLSLPLILFIMPSVFIVVLGPAIISMMDMVG